MSEPLVVVTEADGLVTLKLNRPEARNALSRALLEAFCAEVERVAVRRDVRALIIAGDERAFCAGADLKERKGMSLEQTRSFVRLIRGTMDLVERVPMPTIAAIEGFAFGGGCELALACTLRTASSTARLGLPEVSLGIIPGYGGTQRLARIAGPGVAREWVLTGDIMPAEEAHRVGVINRVFAPEELEAGTVKLAETMLSRAPIALRLGMEAISRGMGVTLREGQTMECDMFGLASTTEDMREGMAAFLEKRSAKFQGK